MGCLAETALRRAYTRHAWTAVSRGGPSGATVFRLDGPSSLYVKIAAANTGPDPGASPRAEAERLAWLGDNGIAAPEPLDTGVIDDYEYLVSGAVPGRPASDPWPAHQRDAVIDAVAAFARDLHSIDAAGCPFDRGLESTVEVALRCARDDLVDRDAMDAERQGWTKTQLVDALESSVAQVRGAEPEVLCHGDFCLPNILIDPETLSATAIVDVGRFGRADRYTDLALMTRSIAHHRMNRQYNHTHAERFLRAYGADPADDTRIAFYRLLDEFF
ncbi:MAG TPA: APH(3') family aminoglycoside O-phosphotransferase [Stackebrandtia sp.]|jgi:kanamycin kinase/aminoglycoside 3'-phosphotransferase-2|uniref:APH(3') family aminoglycoside O-phosphotransferase n=1 Tax=Stackebrandtia sp. TaxID=2023065 RepID=UPI002D3D5E88|nr:APH(3') family aminoglycoside O-phosphotransferase [Stackebrandtia sp.]HZE40812.1 APH(3') family aminoglycoside O-phosphotransferase [Stackebrandtia sp.]